MKHYWFVLILIVLSVSVQAQKSSIVKEINSDKPGEGSITIYQDESIEGLIGSRIIASTSNEGGNVIEFGSTDTNSNSIIKPLHYKESKGYKIQVFSGNEQRKSKNEAYAKKDLISSSYPELEVNVTFKSPVWRVRVGNYRTYEEAFESLKDLKQSFPTFGKEMQIVEAVIKLPVYQ